MSWERIISPGQICNVDETVPQKKLWHKEAKRKYNVVHPVIGCVSASGQAISPFVIFEFWTSSGQRERSVAWAPKVGFTLRFFVAGWLFSSLCCCCSATTAYSHYQPGLVQYAEKDVILPPHTTNESQLLDISASEAKLANRFILSKMITKHQFSPLFNEAWMAMMTPANITSERCGIYPSTLHCTISTDNPAGHVEQLTMRLMKMTGEEMAAIRLWWPWASI